MPAGRYDLELDQGGRFEIIFLWAVDDASRTPIPLSGRTVYMEIEREGIPLLTSNAGGGITLSVEHAGATGQIFVTIPADKTLHLLHPYLSGDALRYFVHINDPGDPGNTIVLLRGLVSIRLAD